MYTSEPSHNWVRRFGKVAIESQRERSIRRMSDIFLKPFEVESTRFARGDCKSYTSVNNALM